MKLEMTPNCRDFRIWHAKEWHTFGCGPGGLGDWVVPDTMWGLRVTEA